MTWANIDAALLTEPASAVFILVGVLALVSLLCFSTDTRRRP